nr:Phosphate starvation-inducible protein PsiF precursor [Candidatus Pantoea persica]
MASMTPQQVKMKRCNSEAGEKNLSGDTRKSFMSGCLKKA